jgi:predicted nucleotidyltransferase
LTEQPIHPDIEMLQIVARALGLLRDEVVFVGGATTTLYIDDPAAPASVATLDVDCVVDISSVLSFAALEETLRKLGFKQPIGEPGVPMCRWSFGEIIVDIIPSDPRILGFSNRWYKDGIANREKRELPDGGSIFVFSLPFFVGSKLEAFKSRGGNDLRFSHDLEDIVLVLSGASNAREALAGVPEALKIYLRHEFSALLGDHLFPEAVSGAMAVRGEEVGRVRGVMDLIRSIASGK